MLWSIVLCLVIACAALYQRLRQAEQKLEDIESRLHEQQWRILALGSADELAERTEVEAQEKAAVVAEPPRRTVSLRTSDAVEQYATVREPAVSEPDQSQEGAAESGHKWFRLHLDFEDIFGRRLPIWAGGITLAVAGVFLVRYSIEAGLLTPEVRVALSFLFGIGLLGSAEAAFRFEDRVRDERVRQALSGAGLATLYAAFYLAGTQYALIGQTFAFLGLGGVTALAIFLSYRFGLPSAVLGLIGGFAAPALVGGEDANLPMLTLYLALVTAGLTQTANRQRRSWLGLGALAGGLGWGALMLLEGNFAFENIFALGLYFIVLGALVPALLDIDRFEQSVRLVAAGIAGVQLAVLVDAGGYQPLAWGLYLSLGAALAWLGWRKPGMRTGNAMAAAIAVILLALWPSPDPMLFTAIAACLALLFAAVPLGLLRRKDGGVLEAFSVAAVTFAIGIVALGTFGTFDRDTLRLSEGAGLILLAVLPAFGAQSLWTREVKGELAANLGSAGLLLFLASVCLLPDVAMPLAASAIAVGLVWLARTQVGANRALDTLLWIAAVGSFITLPVSDAGLAEFETLYAGVSEVSILSFLRWIAAALPWASIAFVRHDARGRSIAEFVAGLLLFSAMAQLLPPVWLVWIAAALVFTIRLRVPERSFAALALIVCMALWAVLPTERWLGEALSALAGEPMLVRYLPELHDVLAFILPLALALAATKIRMPRDFRVPVEMFWASLPLALIVTHTLFKQLFLLDSMPDFAAKGLAERTVWEALLLAIAWSFWKGVRNRKVAIAFAAGSLAHFFWFTAGLHNPLWTHQAVGPVPIANLALAAYTIGVIAMLSVRFWLPAWRKGFDVAVMVLTTLGSITLLRQVFAGSFLDVLPLSQSEDLLRSLVGILLAIAFLLIGSIRGERLWRVGSLVLMTGTVLKVFILDTAGLEGLVRIASFVALGASLIGIGWFYSRQLKGPPESNTTAQ